MDMEAIRALSSIAEGLNISMSRPLTSIAESFQEYNSKHMVCCRIAVGIHAANPDMTSDAAARLAVDTYTAIKERWSQA